MADTLRIRRRVTGLPGAPASLANAELAYNEVDHTLYYGEGTGGSGGSASVIAPIAGQGLAYTSNPAMNGAASAGSAALWARGDHVHPTDTSRAPINSPTFTGVVTIPTGASISGYAPLASPTFTGVPAAPTATAGTNTTQLATTQFVTSAISAVNVGVTSVTAGAGLTGGGTGAVTVSVATNGITNALAAQMPTMTLKGNNSVSTANAADLTAAQAMTLLGAAPLASPTFTGTVTIPAGASISGYAPLASPTFTGIPAAPTPISTTNTTQIATTAFVQSVVSGLATGVTSVTAGTGLTGGGTGAVTVSVATNGITNALAAQMATNTLKGNNTGATANAADLTVAQVMTLLGAAPIASPSFTGIPLAPTATVGTNTTQIATTAFVIAQVPVASSTTPIMDGAAATGVLATYARGDHVHPTDTSRAPINNPTFTGVVTIPAGATISGYAPLASPVFTGTPSLPTGTTGITQASGTNNTTLATTQFAMSVRQDQQAVPTAAVSWNNQALQNLLDPVNPQDAATKNYVDNSILGLNASQACLAATVGANITLSGTQTIDGVALVAGSRVLVKDQTTAANNGIYVVAAGAWTRSADMNNWSEVPATYVFIEQGTVNADTGWLCSSDPGGTLGTTPITWVQFSAAGQITAGNGLSKAGNVLSVVGTANRITVGASVDIAATYVGQSTITTLGTITVGSWNGAMVTVPYGGTGAATLTGYVQGNGTGAMTASATIPSTAITGLGTMSTQNATAVAITGGTIDGITLDCGTF